MKLRQTVIYFKSYDINTYRYRWNLSFNVKSKKWSKHLSCWNGKVKHWQFVSENDPRQKQNSMADIFRCHEINYTEHYYIDGRYRKIYPVPLSSDVFRELADTWYRETDGSSPSRKYNNVAIRDIIAYGKQAIPFILEELKAGRGHWFEALTAIIGQDPIPVEHYGDVPAMQEDWVKYLEQKKVDENG